MDSPSLHILNVGHGSCCIVLGVPGAAIIDAGHQFAHIDFLRVREIYHVDAVLISHADTDHIAGVVSLLLDPDFHVDRVYLNPDASKDTETWTQLRKAFKIARIRHGTVIHTELTTTISKLFWQGDLTIEVLAPTPELSTSGPGGTDLEGQKIDSNAMSAVIRILKSQIPVVLLPGDLDGAGLRRLVEERADVQAHILVFPHHGGAPGKSNLSDFTLQLLEIVRPQLVVFSNGRGKYGLPRPEIIRLIPEATVMCTQLAEECCADLPTHCVSGGEQKRRTSKDDSCAGTISVSFDDGKVTVMPDFNLHGSFVEAFVPSRMCRRQSMVTLTPSKIATQ